jgi:hypothetical protein
MSIISPTTPNTQLPPWITPTLPTSPSSTTTTTPSGLIVVRDHLSQVTAGTKLVVPTSPISGDGALDAAKAAYAELAKESGAPAADILLGGQVDIATQVRNDEIRKQALDAFLAGDVATAGELLGGLH